MFFLLQQDSTKILPLNNNIGEIAKVLMVYLVHTILLSPLDLKSNKIWNQASIVDVSIGPCFILYELLLRAKRGFTKVQSPAFCLPWRRSKITQQKTTIITLCIFSCYILTYTVLKGTISNILKATTGLLPLSISIRK